MFLCAAAKPSRARAYMPFHSSIVGIFSLLAHIVQHLANDNPTRQQEQIDVVYSASISPPLHLSYRASDPNDVYPPNSPQRRAASIQFAFSVVITVRPHLDSLITGDRLPSPTSGRRLLLLLLLLLLASGFAEDAVPVMSESRIFISSPISQTDHQKRWETGCPKRVQ
jgi:hypothetical protein